MPATWSFRHCQLEILKSSALAALTAAIALLPTPLRVDQGGISFRLPGAFGSLAATPVTPDLRDLAEGTSADGGKARDQKIATSDISKTKER